MGIELYWDNDEQTVMLCEFPRKWTWSEMYATLDKIKHVTDHAEQPIAAILDLRQGVSIPGGLFSPSTLEHAKKMLVMGEGGRAPIVVVGAHPLLKTIYNTFRRLDKNGMSNVSFADMPDEARARLVALNYRYEKTPM
jgi:hypothetical protein